MTRERGGDAGFKVLALAKRIDSQPAELFTAAIPTGRDFSKIADPGADMAEWPEYLRVRNWTVAINNILV